MVHDGWVKIYCSTVGSGIILMKHKVQTVYQFKLTDETVKIVNDQKLLIIIKRGQNIQLKPYINKI